MRNIEHNSEQQPAQSLIGTAYTAVASTAVLAIVCCGVYPLLVWGVAQVAMPAAANGSLVTKTGTAAGSDAEAVGSGLIGQVFMSPKYFHPRPSAAGAGYDAAASSGTNLGPTSDKLINGIHGSKNTDGTPNPAGDFDGIKDLAVAYRAENRLPADAVVAADAVTRSASGLDPHISPANAATQAERVAKARGLNVESVRKQIAAATDGAAFGLLGDPGVNVLKLNLALDNASK